MNWEFHPEALDEYEASAAYYAAQDPDLQVRFIEAIETAIDQILESPTRWRVIDEDVRRSSLLRTFFPTVFSTQSHATLF
ncbi:MAG TPA: type II toxin-antitoxin system RelE/ParE family toxin [Pyrinomonadaceae bacterium]|nr:type II toxin-antitoxin system RelE/ParE family toxin [Pyrinomonadaceae bacterium]